MNELLVGLTDEQIGRWTDEWMDGHMVS